MIVIIKDIKIINEFNQNDISQSNYYQNRIHSDEFNIYCIAKVKQNLVEESAYCKIVFRMNNT